MPESSSRVPILELRGVSKRFGAVQALSNVNFEAYAGEVVGLVGDNGAGKSTLIKCVAGIHPADDGEIWFEGQRVHIQNPKDAADLGIQTVYQDLALCDNLDVVANLYLGREQTSRLPLDEVSMEKRSLEVLRDLSVSIPSVRTIIASLSGGQRQSVAISRAVMWNSKLVILDEPTAALGVLQSHQVLQLIKNLRQQGLAVIVISHNLADIFEVVDRISILYLGRNNGVFNVHGTSQEQIVAAITGAEFGNNNQGSAPARQRKGGSSR
ncbi:MAG TPA: ATP-binding cassette domain-containing protein [Anaerolineales bacterium]|nr:ATP-binding cassette domain-containing protein [Anaerolineales bacterium]